MAAIHLAHELVAVGGLGAAGIDAREGRLDAEARTCQQGSFSGYIGLFLRAIREERGDAEASTPQQVSLEPTQGSFLEHVGLFSEACRARLPNLRPAAMVTLSPKP